MRIETTGRDEGGETEIRDTDSLSLSLSPSLSSTSPPAVGIVSCGMHLPEPVLTAADIAEKSGLPEWVVRDKLGIEQKHMAGPDDHPNQMAVLAAQDCLSKTDISPEEIDVVLCTTEEWREYPAPRQFPLAGCRSWRGSPGPP